MTLLSLADWSNPDKSPTPPNGRCVWIRDDFWCTIAIGLLCTGFIFAVLGFVSDVGPGVSLIGFAGGVTGAAILARPIGLIVETNRASVTVRSFASERHLSFLDLFGVDVRPCRHGQGLVIADWPDSTGVRYDVVLCLRDRDEITVRCDLSLQVARMEALRLKNLVARPRT